MCNNFEGIAEVRIDSRSPQFGKILDCVAQSKIYISNSPTFDSICFTSFRENMPLLLTYLLVLKLWQSKRAKGVKNNNVLDYIHILLSDQSTDSCNTKSC
jgi:hypothetical protein